jgi:hypothetical protein
MRKPVLPRFLLMLVCFAAAFLLISNFQFAGSASFTRRAGNLLVAGRFIKPERGRVTLPNTYDLDGGVSVFFGGMEFDLGRKNRDGLVLTTDGEAATAHPLHLGIVDNGVYIRLAEGPELSFITQYSGGVLELAIEADFSPDADFDLAAGDGEKGKEGGVFPGGEDETPPVAVTIPCAPLATSRIREGGSAVVISADGTSYAFSRNAGFPAPDSAVSAITLGTDDYAVSYRVIPERRSVDPDTFILAAAKEPADYDAALALWLDKSYSAWNRASLSIDAGRLFSNDGETVNAYLSEALKRGTYRSAAQAVAAVYAPAAGSAAPWEASVYAGKLDVALRFLSTVERERYTRLARLFNEKSADFLREYRIISYLGIRGYNNLLDDAADMLRAFDPSVITIEQSAGFLEGQYDWEKLRSGRENPFDRFIDQACFVMNDSLRKDPVTGNVLVFNGAEAATEFSLRLGAALIRQTDETRQTLGKSLILSVLALADESGAVPRIVVQGGGGAFTEKEGGGRLSSARIYRIWASDGTETAYFARAAALQTSAARGGMWAWTAAAVAVASENDAELHIAVTFPAGETHYMLLRGVRPFTRIQLHGVDLPSSPQFERSNASGWTYSAAEQTLLVKLRHRSLTEHLRILQTTAPPPPEESAEPAADQP